MESSGSLFADLLGLLPGMRSPTGDFSTTAALAVIVFLAVPFYGIREGLLDPIAVEQVSDFLETLCARLEELDTNLLRALEKGGELNDELQEKLRQAITAGQRAFQARSAG